jgi:threonine dehydratase
MLPDTQQIQDARRLLAKQLVSTPQQRLDHWPDASGLRLHLKHEQRQLTGAFKVRGGLCYVAWLRQTQPTVRHLVTATRGNHGQSIALAAARHGLKVTIVVPHGNSPLKNDAMRALGAELIEAGDDFQAAREQAARIAAEGAHLVPSLHPQLVAGVATYWLEFFDAFPELDCVLVPIGMGSGILGAMAARQALGHKARIIGVVSAHAPAYQLSFEQGEVITAAATTELADGLACRSPDPGALAAMRAGVSRIVGVSDAEVARAIEQAHTRLGITLEGAGAAALAALPLLQAELRGQAVGVALTGANIDPALLARTLAKTRIAQAA